MQGMKDMNFKNVKRTPKASTGDHSAIINLSNADEAFKQAKKLFAEFDNKILDIQVSPKK